MTELNYSSFEQAVYPYCSDVSQIGGYIKQKIGILDEMSRDFFDEYILLAAGLTDASVARMLEGGLKANYHYAVEKIRKFFDTNYSNS